MSYKGYYAKSMVVTRATGIPYRQNDIVVSGVSGRLMIRSSTVDSLGLTEDHFAQMKGSRYSRMWIELRYDPERRLGQHLRFVKGQRNMQCYARKAARQWCRHHGVDELRLRIVAELVESDRVRLLEVERVDDMCEHYHWDSRKKRHETQERTESKETKTETRWKR